jgi:hypothetical protein
VTGTRCDLRQVEGPGLLLSWHYPLSPLRRSIVRASTPGRSEELPLGRRYHPTTSCSAFVVSLHLDGLFRAATVGLLRPTAGLEVHRVLQRPQPGHPKVPRPSALLPAMRFIPFEGFPLSAAVPHHCGLFPSYRWYACLLARPRPRRCRCRRPFGCRSIRTVAPPPPTEVGVGGLSPPKRRQMVRTEQQPKSPLERIASEETMPLRLRSDRSRR